MEDTATTSFKTMADKDAKLHDQITAARIAADDLGTMLITTMRELEASSETKELVYDAFHNMNGRLRLALRTAWTQI